MFADTLASQTGCDISTSVTAYAVHNHSKQMSPFPDRLQHKYIFNFAAAIISIRVMPTTLLASVSIICRGYYRLIEQRAEQKIIFTRQRCILRKKEVAYILR